MGVRFGPERERPPGFQRERKNFEKKFQTGGCYYNFETKYKKIIRFRRSLMVGQEVSKTEGEPTREWTGEGSTHPLVVIGTGH